MTVSGSEIKKVSQGHSDNRKSAADASVKQVQNQGGPRKQMAGQQNSKHYHENGNAFRSNDASDSDAGN